VFAASATPGLQYVLIGLLLGGKLIFVKTLNSRTRSESKFSRDLDSCNKKHLPRIQSASRVLHRRSRISLAFHVTSVNKSALAIVCFASV
jgi:hypothetical protein